MIIIHCPESPKTMYNIQCIFLSIKLIGYVIRSSLKNYSSSVVDGSFMFPFDQKNPASCNAVTFVFFSHSSNLDFEYFDSKNPFWQPNKFKRI